MTENNPGACDGGQCSPKRVPYKPPQATVIKRHTFFTAEELATELEMDAVEMLGRQPTVLYLEQGVPGGKASEAVVAWVLCGAVKLFGR